MHALGSDSKLVRWESLAVKKKDLKCPSYWKFLAQKRCFRLTRRWASYVISLGCIYGFLWLVLSQKLGSGSKEIETLTVIDQVLTNLGQLLQKLCFDGLDWLLQRLWDRILLLYMVWLLSVCIYSTFQ